MKANEQRKQEETLLLEAQDWQQWKSAMQASVSKSQKALPGYTASQEYVNAIVERRRFKLIMAIVISMNAVQVVYESDIGSQCTWGGSQAACDQESGWLMVMNWMYLLLYSIEMSLRIFVHRQGCFTDAWDITDAAIIIIGVLSELLGGLLPSTGILRLFRLARLIKALRFITLPPELHTMIHGFVSAFKAITMGAGLMFLMLLLWAVVGIEVFNDLNQGSYMRTIYESQGCLHCHLAYSSIPRAVFQLTKITIMGEAWAESCIFIEEYPWSVFFFMAVYFSVVLGMSNLVLAVIVEKALLVHQEDLQRDAQAQHDNKTQAVLTFAELCEKLDGDGSGCLSLSELLSGYDEGEEFRDNLRVMDISKEDLKHLFEIMDLDRSGDVSYQEFAMQLAAMQVQKAETQICFIKHWTNDVRNRLEKMMASVESVKGGSQQQGGQTLMAPDSFKLAGARDGGQSPMAPDTSKTAGADIDVLMSPLRLAMKEGMDEIIARNEHWSTELAASLQAIFSEASRAEVHGTQREIKMVTNIEERHTGEGYSAEEEKQASPDLDAEEKHTSHDSAQQESGAAPDSAAESRAGRIDDSLSEDVPVSIQIPEEERSGFPMLAEELIPEESVASAPNRCAVKVHSRESESNSQF
eukprot:gnl/TRDRNA2_/TRDRNA2_174216_c3_seq7.p1 gnl/TRDRNA2_/TRDRNA2_174216_c3~~gnl/TRDRNA2_/TRDRNA2_174216_c3_seq7.p1  ORF type:complete len:639 (+),score=101.30 gnl/TRDRNA2_/TRDRNA2_174216_c3_seq7:60-1976(+)